MNIGKDGGDDLIELNLDEYLRDNFNGVIDFTSCFTPLDTYLHNSTDIKKADYCKQLLLLFRDANVSKSHADRLIRLIRTALPSPILNNE